jgi:hypothetical protein
MTFKDEGIGSILQIYGSCDEKDLSVERHNNKDNVTHSCVAKCHWLKTLRLSFRRSQLQCHFQDLLTLLQIKFKIITDFKFLAACLWHFDDNFHLILLNVQAKFSNRNDL